MKLAAAVVALSLVSAPALAHPGGQTLSCHSLAGAKRTVELSLSRMNGKGWATPAFTMTIDGTAHDFTSDDEMMTFGETVHDSPRGVIRVTADNRENTAATSFGGFTVTAIRRSVKAYDRDGHRVYATAASASQDACYDSNGKAVFRAVFRGWLHDATHDVKLDAQVLECTLEYDSGMAC